MIKIYLDMDGVLARFEQAHEPLKRFASEKGFFQTLEPTEYAYKLRATLEREPLNNLYILTSSPHEQADYDKKEWIKKHIPQLKDRMIFVRSGEAKAQYAKENNISNILIDDYTDNLKHWKEKGGTPVKAVNGLNSKLGTWKQYTKIYKIVDKG